MTSRDEFAELNGYRFFSAYGFQSRTADGCLNPGPERLLEGFAQQAEGGRWRGGTKNEPSRFVGAFRRDSLGEWDGDGHVLVLHWHFNAKGADK